MHICVVISVDRFVILHYVGEENNILKDELIALRMEFVTRRDKYKYTCGLVHELPCLVPRIEKNTLMKLFFDLEGYTWSNNFGWSGQSKTITRHQIDPLEASPIFYDGLTIEVSEDAKDDIGHIIGINLTGTVRNDKKDDLHYIFCSPIITISYNSIK